MFGRKKAVVETAVVEAPESYSVQFTRDAVLVESTSMEFSMAIIEFWEEFHGDKPESKDEKKVPLGFNKDHMSDLESDVDHAAQPDAEEDYDDEDEDD